MTAESIAYSEVDSRRFGKRIYRAIVLDESTARRVCAFAAEQPIDLMVARSPAVALVQILEAAGFFLADTHVTYRGSTSGFTGAPALPGTEIRAYRPADAPELEALARVCFTDYDGHYHADPRLDKAVCTEGYVEWCLSATGDRHARVLVACSDGRLSGFLTMRRPSADAGEVVLNGVGPAYQRRGIYTALFRAAGHRLRREGARELVVATHLSNLAPQKVWVRHGLELHAVRYTLHRWFDGAKFSA